MNETCPVEREQLELEKMMLQSAKNTIRARLPFLMSTVHKWRKKMDIRNENIFRKSALSNAEFANYPFSSIRMFGEHEVSSYSLKLCNSFACALGSTKCSLPNDVRDMDGMSGQKFRSVLNLLVSSIKSAKYLEIGAWTGSTVGAALFGNDAKALCIDNWSQFGGLRDQFLQNVSKLNIKSRLELIDRDFRSVDYGGIGKFNLFLYDGSHNEKDQYDGVLLPQPALKREYYLIIDDWNFPQVRLGTFRALTTSGLVIEFAIEVRTTENDTHGRRFGKNSDWHNGCFLAVIRKPASLGLP